MNKKTFLYVLIIGLLGFFLLQIPFSKVVGSNQQFSLFDFFAPASGAFLTSIYGALTVVFIKFINVIIHSQSFDVATIIRLFPLALGAIYFGTRRYKSVVAIMPLMCMALFIMHPEGRQAWFYSLYWLIPLLSSFMKKSLVANSLGASFTAHAIGSVAFLYAFNLPAEVWIGLIPVVFLERMLMTGGIAVTYLVTNSLVSFLSNKLAWPFLQKFIKPEYTFSKKLLVNL